MVKLITLELNDGKKVSFGKEPLVEQAFNHTVFEFSDRQRLMGAYGH